MKNLICLILILIAVKSIAQTPVLETPIDTTKIVSVEKPIYLEKRGYKIQIPKGWRLAPDCQDNNCSLFSPADTLLLPDTYVENINITVEKLNSPGYTVDQYAAYSITYLPKVVQNFKLISKKKLNANSFVVEYKGLKNNFLQTWRQFYYVKNAKVFIVTLATETPKYEYYKPLIESNLKSFKLL
jgi:hypothetical protein